VDLQAAACEIAGQIEEAVSLLDAALQLVERTGERWIEAEVGGYAPTRILLDEAYDGVRHVGILQSGDLISGQLDVHRGQRIVEMVERRSAR